MHSRPTGVPGALTLLLAAVLTTACSATPRADDGEVPDGSGATGPPERITIVPDDFNVPYAGTAEDGRRFFLSEALFDDDTNYVGLFLWRADGAFDEVLVEAVDRPAGLPPGQAGAGGADDVVAAQLRSLGDYVLEPIEVEPFLERVDGVEFGWRVTEFDGEYSVNVEPGNFIAYCAPWDGLEYDT